jgi:hypothetical protein
MIPGRAHVELRLPQMLRPTSAGGGWADGDRPAPHPRRVLHRAVSHQGCVLILGGLTHPCVGQHPLTPERTRAGRLALLVSSRAQSRLRLLPTPMLGASIAHHNEDSENDGHRVERGARDAGSRGRASRDSSFGSPAGGRGGEGASAASEPSAACRSRTLDRRRERC